MCVQTPVVRLAAHCYVHRAVTAEGLMKDAWLLTSSNSLLSFSFLCCWCCALTPVVTQVFIEIKNRWNRIEDLVLSFVFFTRPNPPILYTNNSLNLKSNIGNALDQKVLAWNVENINNSSSHPCTVNSTWLVSNVKRRKLWLVCVWPESASYVDLVRWPTTVR